MTFLSPLFLLGALAVAVPVFLHLFRRRAEPVIAFSALRLLRRTPVEQSRRRQLRERLLLALRAAALLLLALAFARPYFSAGPQAGSSPVTVVAVDASYSLTAPGALDRARTLAREAIRQAPGGHAVALIRFADSADLLVAPTTDRGAADAAAGSLAATAGGTQYRAGLARAVEAIGTRGGRIVVVTDLQAGGWEGGPPALVPPDVPVEVRAVPPPASNLAVVGLTRTANRLQVLLRSTAADERTARVSLAVDSAPLAETSVAVPGGGTAEAVFTRDLPARGALSASVDDEIGYQADNARYHVLEGPAKPPVLVVTGPGTGTGEAFYVERALAAAEGDRGVTIERRTADRLPPDTAFDKYAALIVLGTSGLDRRTGDAIAGFVRSGGGLLVVAGPAVDGDLASAAFGRDLVRLGAPGGDGTLRSFAPADLRHPIFRPFARNPGALADVRFRRTAALDESGATTLARFDDGRAALVEREAGRGRVLLLASDLATHWNDLPLQPIFVPLVAEAVGYLAAGRRPAGELTIGVSPRSHGLAPGVMEVRQADGTGGRVAVNVSPREAEVATLETDAFLAMVERAPAQAASAAVEARRQESDQGLWRYGLLLVLGSLVVEGLVGRR